MAVTRARGAGGWRSGGGEGARGRGLEGAGGVGVGPGRGRGRGAAGEVAIGCPDLATPGPAQEAELVGAVGGVGTGDGVAAVSDVVVSVGAGEEAASATFSARVFRAFRAATACFARLRSSSFS